MELENLTIRKAAKAMRSHEYTSEDLVRAYLKMIEENKDINAYLEVFDDAIEEAKKADIRIKNGESNLLCGIPIAVKDNILIEGKRVTAASKILEGYVATYDSTVIKKMREAGAVFIGRTNMDEFAMGGSTENSAYGVTLNPHDKTRVPGGSSGGSAAALAMKGALIALGTDTGGSVRQPASFCGVVGLKPTYGAVSRYGLIAMGSSLDQAGPITYSVDDAEIVFNAIKGKDEKDSTSLQVEEVFGETPKKEKIKIGIPRSFLKEGVHESVLQNFNDSVSRLEKLGFLISDIDLPNIEKSLAVYYVLMPAEVSTNLSRFDGIRYGKRVEGNTLLEDYENSRGSGFGVEARRRIILGNYVLSHGYYDAYYNKSLAVREIIKKEFREVFLSVDAILTPTTPTPAFKIGEKTNDPLSMYLADIFTTPANIAGIPAISLPSGFVEVEGKKLPLGIQLMSAHGGENTLFSIGKAFLGEVE